MQTELNVEAIPANGGNSAPEPQNLSTSVKQPEGSSVDCSPGGNEDVDRAAI